MEKNQSPDMPKGWRFKLGVLCIILNLAIAPIITQFIAMFDLSTGAKTAITTFYRIGNVFMSPLLAIATPFFDIFFSGWLPNPLLTGIIGDTSLILSLLVLGENFWEKLRGLFIRTATTNISTAEIK